jgi:MerR family copper efflux transcriptional regulator
MGRTVSQVAPEVGLPTRTVRYYARIGLVAPSGRSRAGYRLYDAADEGKLRFVRQAKALGFTLRDIRQLITAAENGCCGQVMAELQQMLRDKIASVDASIAELQAFRRRLVGYADGTRSGCGCTGHGVFCSCLNGVPSNENPNGKEQGHV